MKTIKTAILYAVEYGKGCAGPYWPVHIEGRDQPPIFVRAEIVNTSDVAHALSLANPRPDEIVLNTIEIDPNTISLPASEPLPFGSALHDNRREGETLPKENQ